MHWDLAPKTKNWRFEPTYNNRANTWQMEKRRKVFVQVVAASWELNIFSSMIYLDTSRQKPSPRILLGQTGCYTFSKPFKKHNF